MKNVLRLLFGIAFLVLFLEWAKLFDFFDYVGEINLFLFGAACILSALTQVVRAGRFKFMTSALKIKLSFYKLVLVQYLATVGGLMTPAKMGEGSKILFFEKKHMGKLGELFVIEKISDFLLLFIFSALSLTILGQYVEAVIIFFVLFLIGLFALIKFDKVFNKISEFLFKNERLKVDFKNAFRRFCKNRKLIQGTVLLTLLTWLTIYCNIYLFLKAVGISVNILTIAYFFSMSSLLGAISGVPGGLGVREVSFAYLLITFANVSKELAALGALAYIFGTYGTLFIAFLVSSLLLRKIK